MIKHPLLLNKTLYFFLDYKLGEEVFDKPWIISALTNHRGLCEYGGYKTFNNLLRVSEKVEENFGEIVNFYRREFADGLLMCFLTQKEDKNYLVSLGANTVTAKQRTALTQLTPEEKLLRQIFGEKAIPTEEQEIRPHYEYVCEIDVIEDEKVYDVIYLLAVLKSCLKEILVLLNGEHGRKIKVIKLTKDGNPVHPLYQSKTSVLIDYK